MAANDYISSGAFTIGPNNSVTIFESLTNIEVSWGLATEINWKSNAVIERKPVNLMRGIKRDLIFLQGWKGDFTIQRTDSSLDVYWSALEAAVRAGVAIPEFTIIQKIMETDGTITELTFIQSQVTYDDAGTYANEEGVIQMLNFTSPARQVRKI